MEKAIRFWRILQRLFEFYRHLAKLNSFSSPKMKGVDDDAGAGEETGETTDPAMTVPKSSSKSV